MVSTRFALLASALAATTALAAFPDSQHGYVDVRTGAHMYWWFFKTTHDNPSTTPIILWLQGGPGASGIGYGNFGEFGPRDINLKPRNTTWLSAANLLFVDSPVGSGYSYVDDLTLLPTTNVQIAADLVTLLTAFVGALPDASTTPFFIFSESYGGKMAIQLADALTAAIDAGTLKLNLRGVALGDSWISGIDYVDTWAPFLRATSLMSEHAKTTRVDPLVQQCDNAVQSGNWTEATNYWGRVEGAIQDTTNGVNFYNILNWSCEPLCATRSLHYMSPAAAALAPNGIDRSLLAAAFTRRMSVYLADPISDLMNGPIRAELGDIPASVTWGSQSDAVFSTLSGDFMRPVVDVVDRVLGARRINVTVYEGQVDLICGTMGAERWMTRLTWPGMSTFYSQARVPFYAGGDTVNTAGFSTTVPGLNLWHILKAGHMVPSDAGDAALFMVNAILSSEQA